MNMFRLRHSQESLSSSFRRRPESSSIMRPKDTQTVLSASHDVFNWIPAFAGMTGVGCSVPMRNLATFGSAGAFPDTQRLSSEQR
jgi:hypothetical protein